MEAAATALQASDSSALDATALADRIARLEVTMARLAAHQVACVAVFDGRGDAEAAGARSSKAWLRHRLRLSAGEASARVGLARRLKHRRATAVAFAAGEIRCRHAEVITRALDELAPALDGPAAVEEVESALVDAARLADPVRLAAHCRRLRDAVDPDAVPAADWDAFTARTLSLSRTIGGMIAIDGMLDPLTGETVLAGLHALSAPTGTGDDRTPGQRRADALADLARRVLAIDESLPSVGGERPQVLVTVDLATLERRAAQAAAGMLPGLTTPTPSDPASSPAAGRASGGLTDRPGAELAWAGPIGGELARRICCDAMISRVITDGASQPLDVGRATRVVPAGMRRALLIRDRTCQYPGCSVPGQWCDAHHLRHWVLGGETMLGNLVLLCPFHHTRLHLSGQWIIRRPDGTMELGSDHHLDHHDTGPPGDDGRAA